MVKLRLAAADDAAALARIYAPFVTGTAASFETVPPDERVMAERILAGGALHPWLVAVDEAGKIDGFAASSRFRPREAYRFTVETSVYLDPAAAGRGIGRRLYGALLDLLTAQGFVQAIAAITAPNPASERLHARLGFAPAGTYRDVGYKLGGWRSVALWQRPLAPAAAEPAEPKPFGPCLAALEIET